MGMKTKRLKHDVTYNHSGKTLVRNASYIAGDPTTYIAAGSVLSVALFLDGHLVVAAAYDAGVTLENMLGVAGTEIREYGPMVTWFIKDHDTSGDSVGDLVYLSTSSSPGGEITTTPPAGSPVIVGKVVAVGTLGTGKVYLKPTQ